MHNNKIEELSYQSTKHVKDNQLPSLSHPLECISYDCKCDTKKFHGNKFDSIFSKKARGQEQIINLLMTPTNVNIWEIENWGKTIWNGELREHVLTDLFYESDL